MNRRTRYFVLVTVGALLIGLAGGLIAYLAYTRNADLTGGVPPELRFVPADAAMVAFADVAAIMRSDVRRALMSRIDPESRKGRQMMNDFVGLDLEKQVSRIVVYVERHTPPDPQARTKPQLPRTLVLLQGTFEPARIEAFIRQRSGTVSEYKNRKIFVSAKDGHEMAVGFVDSNLIAMGQSDLVRRAMDTALDGAPSANGITANAEMMHLIRDSAGSTAWVVGGFDEMSRRMRLPNSVAARVPPIRLVSVQADINGGIKATVRAEAGDEAAADQLRDVVRGFISLARLQASGGQEFVDVLKSIELSGSDTTVRLSVAVAPETLRAIAPGGLRRGDSGNSAAPTPPPAK